MKIRDLILLFMVLGVIPGASAIAAELRKAFHVAGLADIKRGQRVDVSFNDDELVFEKTRSGGSTYHLPYSRIKHVLLLHSERHYEKSTVAAAMGTAAFGVPIGTLLILKKHKVDTLIIDYRNERDGRMGIILQVERNQEQEMSARFKQRGVVIADPPPDKLPAASVKKPGAQSKVQE